MVVVWDFISILIGIILAILLWFLLWTCMSFSEEYSMFNNHYIESHFSHNETRIQVNYSDIEHFLNSTKFDGAIHRPYKTISIKRATKTELTIDYKESYPGTPYEYWTRYHVEFSFIDYIRYRIDLTIILLKRRLEIC